jgi:hypothetical protein
MFSLYLVAVYLGQHLAKHPLTAINTQSVTGNAFITQRYLDAPLEAVTVSIHHWTTRFIKHVLFNGREVFIGNRQYFIGNEFVSSLTRESVLLG